MESVRYYVWNEGEVEVFRSEMEGYLRYEEDADNIDVVVGLWCPGTWGLLLSLLESSSRGVGSLYHGREITTCGTSSLDSS